MIISISGFTPAFEIKVDFKYLKSTFSLEYNIDKDELVYAEYIYVDDYMQENISVFKLYKHLLEDSLKQNDILYMYQSPDHDKQELAEIDFEKFLDVLKELKNILLLKIGV